MQKNNASRRSFLKKSAISLAATPFVDLSSLDQKRSEDMTIQQAIDFIISKIPGGKREDTVDTVKSSDPNQKLTGIVSTFLATVEVIREAIEKKANLIITHEPTFYNHLDETAWLSEDPVYKFKRDLLEKNNIVVWRFHDYWHRHEPDGILNGLLNDLEWQSYLVKEPWNTCVIPETSMKKLAKFLKKKLKLDRTFMVGNPDMRCAKIGLLPGSYGRDPHIQLLREDIDVLVVGEVSEWETSEYVRDAALAGMKKGLIILGHAMSEEPGMAYLVEWLNEYMPEVPAFHVPSKDAFISV